MTSFLSTYAAIRFTTGKKAPGVLGPLVKVFILIVWMTLLLPIALAELVLKALNEARKPPPPERNRNGSYWHFQDSIDELTEAMK